MGYFLKKKSKNRGNHSNFEIDFDKELSNGALVFNIVDDEHQHFGHVVVSPNGTVTNIKSTAFDDFNDTDENYLNQQAKKFYDATH